MNRFLCILNTEKPLTPANYPALFRFFESMQGGVRFLPDVIAFEFAGDSEAASNAIYGHLQGGDEAIVFELAGAFWRVDRLKAGEKRDAKLRKFFGQMPNEGDRSSAAEE